MTKTVLIADDSASVRLSVRLLLQGRHKEIVVREAFDGMDAIEKAKKSKPDLILLDLAMPRVNGAEAATVLKNDLPDTPVTLRSLLSTATRGAEKLGLQCSNLARPEDFVYALLSRDTSPKRC